MIHLKNAHKAFYENEKNFTPDVTECITAHDNTVRFTIQDGPIGDVGINGIQVTDMLEYINEVYKSLNKAFPCRENSLTITKIEEAIHWQDARTKDRVARNVEGKNLD